MSELEPNDSRVVHGNAKPEKGDERFAQKSDRAEAPTQDDRFDHANSLPEDGERGSQPEQSRDNDAQFEASDLDRGEMQYQDDPLVQQQHQSNDWSDEQKIDSTDFETGQADYGGAQARQELVDEADEEGDLSDEDIEDAAPEQAQIDLEDDELND